MDTPRPGTSNTAVHQSGPKNLGTLPITDLPAASANARARAVPPAEAYRLSVAAARLLPAASAIGYRLFWVRGADCGCIELAPERGKHVVVGRHDRCDIVLDDERTVSLRHVMLRVSAVDNGQPALDILDLQTEQGFELSDGSRQRRVVATGPLVFRVGVYALVAIPNGTELETELPEPMVDAADASPYAVSPEAVAPGPSPHARTRPRITSIPSFGMLGDADGRGGPSDAEHYELQIEMGSHHAAIRLTARDVEHGALIGRDGKCVDAGLHAILSEAISLSRVHALILRGADGVFLYDCATTNGIITGGGRARCVGLSDAGIRVALPGTNEHPLYLRWRALPRY